MPSKMYSADSAIVDIAVKTGGIMAWL